MSFGNPLGLLALLALPAIVVLHLLRRRRKERRVAGLFLFADEVRATPAGRTIEPLRRSASLWLELAAATVLALLIAEPQFGVRERPDHLVVVLDDSASMSGHTAKGAVRERAVDLVSRRVSEVGSGAVVSIVTTGARPDVLAGPRVPPSVALDALARWSPRRTSHDERPALGLALDLAGPKGRVLFVTDREVADPPSSIDVESVGEASDNVAIVSAIRETRGEKETIRLALRAYSLRPIDATARVSAIAGETVRELVSRPVRLDPAHPSEFSIELPRVELPLRIELSADALAVDSSVTLLPTPRRTVLLGWTLAADVADRLGLSRLARILPDVALERDASKATFLIAGDDAPPPIGGMRLVLSMPGTERDDWLGPFLRERRDPLLEGMTLEGVVWSAGRGDVAGRPLVFASEQVLLARDRTPDGTVVRWNVDPVRSTLLESADWPILMANLVEEVRRGLPGVVEPNVKVGDTMALRHGFDAVTAGSVRLVTPSGASVRLSGRRLAQWDAEEAGIHRLTGLASLDAAWSAAFVDSAESDLRRAATGSRPGSATGPPSDAAGRSDDVTLLGSTGVETRIGVVALLLLAAAVWWEGQRVGHRSGADSSRSRRP